MRERTLGWLDMQGYDLSDEEKVRLTIPIKFSLAVCTALGAVFLGTQSVPGLSALAGVALLGAILPRHPFDYAYAAVVEPLLRTGVAPPNPAQRRFACAMATSMLAVMAAAFAVGVDPLAWAIGAIFLAVAGTVTLTNWCLPSFIFNAIVGYQAPRARA